MKHLILSLVALLSLSQGASAAIVFTITPDGGLNTFNPGQTAQFNLFVRSDVAGGTQIDSLDVNVNAGAGNGTGGVFSSGTTLLLGSVPFDVSSTPGQAFSTNFQNGGTLIPFADGIGNNLGVLYGQLFLNTTGVGPGTYALTLDQLNANPFWNGVGAPPPPVASIAVNSSYIIQTTGVPEPSSMALLGLASVGFVGRSLRRRFQK